MKRLATLLLLLATAGLPAAAIAAPACPALLDHTVKRLPGGKAENLCQYQGKVILVVNTASRCGFTPQFDGLQKIYRDYQARGFVVLGFPSNDFNQEPGKGEQITNFCRLNYGVDFPMFEKNPVKGAGAQPFYQALIKATGSEPRWNFHKYLVTRDGKTVVPLDTRVEPDSREMRAKIEAMLDRKN